MEQYVYFESDKKKHEYDACSVQIFLNVKTGGAYCYH